jgi:hypothetical protein
MSTLPKWLLNWAEGQRYGGQVDEENTWIRILDELVEFQHYHLDSPFRSQTLQELLALVYQPHVREGYSVNTKHGSLRPPVTLTRIGKRVSMKQFLPALVDILDRDQNETFEKFIEPLQMFLGLRKEAAMEMLERNRMAENAKLTALPKGIPRTRRQVVRGGAEAEEPPSWRIRPGQFGTSGQSRRAFMLDMLAARASAGEDVFEGIDYLSDEQREEILQRLRVFEDESQFAKQDERVRGQAKAIGTEMKRSNRRRVMDAMQPLFANGVRDTNTFESVVLGLLQATDPDLAKVAGADLAAMFAESCATSQTVGQCMNKLRGMLCGRIPELVERVSNLGFPMDPCGDSGRRK